MPDALAKPGGLVFGRPVMLVCWCSCPVPVEVWYTVGVHRGRARDAPGSGLERHRGDVAKW